MRVCVCVLVFEGPFFGVGLKASQKENHNPVGRHPSPDPRKSSFEYGSGMAYQDNLGLQHWLSESGVALEGAQEVPKDNSDSAR